MNIYLIFDGGNGASCSKEAYGSFIIRADSKTGPLITQQRVIHGTGYTNNEAEYLTLIAALKHIATHITLYPEEIRLTIEGDSELVRHQIGTYRKTNAENWPFAWEGWQVNKPHLLTLRKTARDLLEKFHSFIYHHIPREEVVSILGH